MRSKIDRNTNLSALLHALAAAATLASPTVMATCIGGPTVTSCADDNSRGTLRSIVTCADSGDIVDLSGLTTASPSCSSGAITLTQGALTIAQSTLTLKGPSEMTPHLALRAPLGSHARVLYHSGTGNLGIRYLTIADGNYSGTAATGMFYGGCIASQGYLFISNATIEGCSLTASGGANASGGGMWSALGMDLANVTISGNQIAAGDGGFTQGGGIATNGQLSMIDSTISGNTSATLGGGIALLGPSAGTHAVYISYSTISNNAAVVSGGGAFVDAYKTSLHNSTVSSNTSTEGVSGLMIRGPAVISNSTIAFNTSRSTSTTQAALYLQMIPGNPFSLDMQSTIVSNNPGVGGTRDMYVETGATITGSKNLVYAPVAGGTALPSGFGLAAGTCPLLGPLRDNNASIQTHALLSGSPALAAGSNPLDFKNDQRGDGFPRMSSGSFGIMFTDIGAYQMQRDDVVFNTSFDGCP